THYLEEAEMLCRHIGIINNGELIENTSMRNLLAKMQSETFIFDFIPTEITPQLPNYKAKLVDTGVLEVEVRRNEGLNQLFDLFAQQGMKILSMRNKANRLEELFVHLVSGKQGGTNE
ncbi:MAG: ABC transporter ATP-binding protein, partial [Candidatus Schmidhempelia sp.]|nr:ABC transporter ATP-binding protein [Candidatus Schmidhempelia sp.]